MRPPQQTDNKRLFLAAGISMLLLIVWQMFFMPDPPEQEESADAGQESTETTGSDSVSGGDGGGDAAVGGEDASDAGGTDGPAAVARTVAPVVTALDTEAYTLQLTNVGGRAFGFEQKLPQRYEGIDFLEPLVGSDFDELDPPDELPFETELSDIGLGSGSRFALDDAAEAGTVAFDWTSADGSIEVRKIFRAGETGHAVSMVMEITNNGDRALDDSLDLVLYNRQLEGDESFFAPGRPVDAVCLADGDVERVAQDDDPESYTEAVDWAGVDESYFAILARAEADVDECLITGGSGGLVSATLTVDVSVAPKTTESVAFEVYMGPKERDLLDEFGHDIQRSIDFGFFEIIARPIAWLLRFFHDLVGNWGIAIIILTILIRGALWPVTQKSQDSMMRMRDIQPQLKEIQEKYKKDPAILQQKQMQLFKENKVNPFGCLPLFLQIPIWFSLYRTIYVTAELYRVPFGGWIPDLSAADPYYILPVIAGGLFFVQQRLSPTSITDPKQKILMTVLPLVFSVVMLFLPAGLNLYILCSSLIGMSQVIYTRKKMAKRKEEDGETEEEVADHRPRTAKERRAARRRGELDEEEESSSKKKKKKKSRKKAESGDADEDDDGNDVDDDDLDDDDLDDDEEDVSDGDSEDEASSAETSDDDEEEDEDEDEDDKA